MIGRLRNRELFSRRSAEQEVEVGGESPFSALRLLTADLLLATGVHTTLNHLRRTAGRPADEGSSTESATDRGASPSDPLPYPAVLAPAVLGPLACMAQVAHVLRPSESTLLATRVLNGAVLGVGLAGVAETLYGMYGRDEAFSAAPLLFGYSGVLGFFLDRQESGVRKERESLAKRARVVERLVPKRQPKLHKIVVHV